MEKLLKDIEKNNKTCIFVSPHLDDAALSCGGLISYLANKVDVFVITVFTKAGNNKHSLSALAYVKKCGYKISEIDKFYSDRRKEDRKTFARFMIETKHLGFLDALWRKRNNICLVNKILSLLLSEFELIYPTHRLHIAKGVVHKEDAQTVRSLRAKLKNITTKNSVVFCPLAIGKHVDHVVVREVCQDLRLPIIFWSDYNYNLYHKPDKNFLSEFGLKRHIFRKNQNLRKKLILGYKTQVGKLFSGRDFKLPPEKYYM